MADVTMRQRRLARAIAAATATLLFLPTVAHAERVATWDAGRDVVRFDEEASEVAHEEVVIAQPGNATSDITRVVVDHRARLLRVTVQVRDLRDTFAERVSIRLRSQQRLFEVQATRRGRHTYTSMTRGHRGTGMTCGGLVTEVDTVADTMVVSVPTTCIEDPRWVRVGVTMIGFSVADASETEDGVVLLIDEAGVTGFHGDRPPVLGPKVHRG